MWSPCAQQFAEVLVVRPGLTDLASVKYINESAVLACFSNPEEAYQTKILPEKLRLAKLYVRHMSFRLDFAILVQTLLRMVNSSYVACEMPELDVAPKPPSAFPWARVSSFILKWRRPMIVLLDVALILAANYLAFVLRFDGNLSSQEIEQFQETILPLIGIRAVAFSIFGLHAGLWRYTSIWDLQNIVSGVLTSTMVFYGWVNWGMEIGQLSALYFRHRQPLADRISYGREIAFQDLP